MRNAALRKLHVVVSCLKIAPEVKKKLSNVIFTMFSSSEVLFLHLQIK